MKTVEEAAAAVDEMMNAVYQAGESSTIHQSSSFRDTYPSLVDETEDADGGEESSDDDERGDNGKDEDEDELEQAGSDEATVSTTPIVWHGLISNSPE